MTAETRAYFEAKTAAMLNEQMLSVCLRAQGCRLVDATWAHGVVTDGGAFPGPIPDWRTQLARRPVDAFPLHLTTPFVTDPTARNTCDESK